VAKDKKKKKNDKDIPAEFEESLTERTIIQPRDERLGVPIKSGWGSSIFDEYTQLSIHVGNSVKPLVVKPTSAVTLGRSDVSGPQPDVDLSQYGAAEKGVSRVHAELRLDNDVLFIVDLGSTNGTYLNEEFLSHNMPHMLHDGDTIRLGSLVIHIYFK